MNPSKDGFIETRNERSPRFVSNSIHTKGDTENLQGNGYEKDSSASKDKPQQLKNEKRFDTQSSLSLSLSKALFFTRKNTLSKTLLERIWKMMARVRVSLS